MRHEDDPTDESRSPSPESSPAESAPTTDAAPVGASYIAFVENPFEIRSAEILAAQQEDGELELDTDLANLEEIAEAVEEATAANDETQASAEFEAQREAEAELAAQIAEDEALEKALAAEDEIEIQAALPASTDAETLDRDELQSCLEALLFMTDKPLSLDKLHDLIGPDFPKELFETAMASLCERYQGVHHGIELVHVGGGYVFRTKPGRAALARKLAKITTQRLSTGAMETLAIVAYRQPALKDDIDKIRGVDSSHFIRGLLEKKLIQISGRSELPGRPMLYTTTQEFLEIFGIPDLTALPSLRELEDMVPASESKDPENEDPKIKQMRKLIDQMNMQSSSLGYDPREDEKILADIRDRVKSIPTSTPYLEEQKALEKQAAALAESANATPELPLESVPAETASTPEPETPATDDHLQ